MPATFFNNINFIKKDPKPKKKPKQPPLAPQLVPAFKPLQIDNYNNYRAPNIPTSLNQHNPLTVFRLFFSNIIVDKMVDWINKYAASYAPSKEDI